MMAKVVACITTRDGKPDFHVHRKLQAACQYAADVGIETSLAVTADNFSIGKARNSAVLAFLEDKDATHLFFVDNDVHIQEDAIVVLVAMDKPISAGCYASFKTPPNHPGMHKPYITVKKEGAWYTTWWDGVVQVDGAGTGCMLIRRDVFEEMKYPWFVWREYVEDGVIKHKSDDIDFCDRAIAQGLSVWAHGNVRCGHIKTTDASCFIFEDKVLDVDWHGPRTVAQQMRWPDYGSHVPAIQTVLSECSIRTAVEYGSGRFSTPVILAHDELESLVSYESDAKWAMDTRRRNEDERLECVLCPVEQMAEHLHPEVDLVLIDCDTVNKDGAHVAGSFDARLDLLREYEKTRCIVVLHDYNFEDIKPTVDESSFKYRSVYTPSHGPQTVVLSNAVDVSSLNWVDSNRKSLELEPVEA
jgi:hypothetical protein